MKPKPSHTGRRRTSFCLMPDAASVQTFACLYNRDSSSRAAGRTVASRAPSQRRTTLPGSFWYISLPCRIV
ncbi:MAG: hypothetical protein ACJ741_14100 [Pyrinomonadaceae bacterium]